MFTEGINPEGQTERKLRIAGRLIEKALQDVQRAKHCVTLVPQYSIISATSGQIKSEEIRVMDILTTGARKDLAKALSILNSVTSEARSSMLKNPDSSTERPTSGDQQSQPQRKGT